MHYSYMIQPPDDKAVDEAVVLIGYDMTGVTYFY